MLFSLSIMPKFNIYSYNVCSDVVNWYNCCVYYTFPRITGYITKGVVELLVCQLFCHYINALIFKVPFCGNSSKSLIGESVLLNCEGAVGYLAVYRICFILTCFFFLMGLITIGVKTSKDPRAGIHNG